MWNKIHTKKNFILIVVIIISKRSHKSHVVQNHTQYKIYVLFPTLYAWKIAFLQKGIFIVVMFIFQKEPSASTLLEDDVCLIALGLNIQLAFHLPQLVL